MYKQVVLNSEKHAIFYHVIDGTKGKNTTTTADKSSSCHVAWTKVTYGNCTLTKKDI